VCAARALRCARTRRGGSRRRDRRHP
jgi:hypothetical protein